MKGHRNWTKQFDIWCFKSRTIPVAPMSVFVYKCLHMVWTRWALIFLIHSRHCISAYTANVNVSKVTGDWNPNELCNNFLFYVQN